MLLARTLIALCIVECIEGKFEVMSYAMLDYRGRKYKLDRKMLVGKQRKPTDNAQLPPPEWVKNAVKY